MTFSCPLPVHGHPIDCGFAQYSAFKMIILGILQGITELLPISSTAHMRVFPAFFGWEDPGTPFSGAAQLASFMAVLLYFKKDISDIFFGFFKSISTKTYSSHEFKLGLGILLGSLPIGIGGLLLSRILNQPNSPLRSLYTIGCACIVMGILFVITEKFCKPTKDLTKVTLKHALIIGLFQLGALIPGVSRSGSTITAGLFLGFKRETAATFSFILGVPVIVLAGLHELKILYSAGLSLHGWYLLTIGLVSATISAFAAVFWLLSYLEKHSTYLFAWYRIVLGFFLIIGAYFGWLH